MSETSVVSGVNSQSPSRRTKIQEAGLDAHPGWRMCGFRDQGVEIGRFRGGDVWV